MKDLDNILDGVEFLSEKQISKATKGALIKLRWASMPEQQKQDWAEKARKITKDKWASDPEGEKNKRAIRNWSNEDRKKASDHAHNTIANPKNRAKNNQTKIDRGNMRSEAQWQEIYDQTWGPDRFSDKLRNKLCKKYSVKPGSYRTLLYVGKQLNLYPETRANHKEKLKEWHKKYGRSKFIYEIITPEGKKYQFDDQISANNWMLKNINIYANYDRAVYRWFIKNKKLKAGKFKNWSFSRSKRIID
jgi:hypothetical protein